MTEVPGLMTRIFLNTEFVDDGRVIEPASLALVSETRAEYYAVFADGGADRGGDASSFGLIGRYGGIRREGQRAYGPQRLPGDGERPAAGGQDPHVNNVPGSG